MLQQICFSQNSFELDDPWSVTTQSMDVDSLEILLNKTNNDSIKTLILNEISLRSAFNKPQKGLSYSEQSLELAERLEFKEGVAGANLSKVYCGQRIITVIRCNWHWRLCVSMRIWRIESE